MNLTLLPQSFAVCQIDDPAKVPWQAPYVFVAQTDEELSLVCPADSLPEHLKACERGWRALKVVGPLDFGLVGILAELAEVLASRHIPIFALSTYNTDYLLVKEKDIAQAVAVLKEAGHLFV